MNTIIKNISYISIIAISHVASAAEFTSLNLDSLIAEVQQGDDSEDPFLNLDHDLLQFVDAPQYNITLGAKLGGGGTKTAYSALTKREGDWIVFLPNKISCAKTWLQLLQHETGASEHVRRLNPVNAQEFKWVVIEKSNPKRRVITLAARNFLGLAVQQNLFVYDHKGWQDNVFSRFKSYPFFSGVTEDEFFSETFWEKALQDVCRLIKNGWPIRLLTDDSINLVIHSEGKPGQQALIAKPFTNDDRGVLSRPANTLNPTIKKILEQKLEEPNLDANTRKNIEADLGITDKQWLDSQDFVFDGSRGHYVTFFLFDAGQGDASNLSITNRSVLEKRLNYIIGEIVIHASRPLFSVQQFIDPTFVNRQNELIRVLVQKALGRIYQDK